MSLNPKKFFAKFLILVVSVFAVHFLIYRAALANMGLQFMSLIEVYIFLIVLSVAHFYGIYWLFKKWPKYAGFIFTGFSLLKMLVSILFLLPYIFPAKQEAVVLVINFMVIYFILLTYEVVYIAKNIGKNH